MEETDVDEGSSNPDTLPLGHPEADNKASDQQKTIPRALTFCHAAFLAVGGAFGAGVVVVPSVLKQTGWFGLVLISVCVLTVGYCCHILGRCWVILLERYPEARIETRRPYPLIAEKAFGKRMTLLTGIALNVACLGGSVVLLLLSAQNLESLLGRVGISLSQCFWLLILSAILVPFTWLDTPKDFWGYGLIGFFATLTAAASTLVALLLETADGKKGIPQRNPSVHGLFISLGSVVFSVSLPQFLNIQHDMQRPEQSPRVVFYAYGVPLAAYVVLSFFGYLVYGRDLEDNILQSLPDGWSRIVGELAICVHCILVVLVVINTVNQLAESSLGIGSDFTWKKCVLRSSIFVLVLFVAETVPRFDVVLNIFAAGPLMYLDVIAPALFYLRLSSQKGQWPDRSLPLHVRVFCLELICVGIFVACVSTYYAVFELVDVHSSTFVPPCYVNVNVPSDTT